MADDDRDGGDFHYSNINCRNNYDYNKQFNLRVLSNKTLQFESL